MRQRILLGVTALAAAMILAGRVPAVAAEAGCKMINLKPIVNMDWRDEVWGDGHGGWTDQGDTDLRNIEVGTKTFFGIPFEVIDPAKNGGKAVLTLKSKKFSPGPVTATAAVGMKARSLYVLHASAWTGGHMATYIVHYDDGTDAEIPVRAKEEICDWWGPTHGAKYRVAFQVPSAKTDAVGMLVFGWDNPAPDKLIKSIEFKSQMADGIVLVAAVTASDKPVSLPDPKDIPEPDYLKSDLDTLDKGQWFPVEVVPDEFGPTPIDQAATLDAPAGKHGFMRTVQGRWVFEDGTPVRLVATMQGTPRDKKESEYQARWLAKYGFNMVRIGHLVTGPEENSAVDWHQADSRHLNPKTMDQLDYLIAELAKRGIYSRLTMIWYRKAKKGDGLDGFDESVAYADQKAKRTRKPGEEAVFDTVGSTFFDPKVIEFNIDLEKAIMTHKNPYRDNKMYGEDPAICQIEVTNEDGVFFYTIDGMSPFYQKRLDRLWADWLLKKYGSEEKLREAWGNDLAAEEKLADGTVKRLIIWQFNNVPKAKLPRARDQLRFYVEIESAYFNKTKDALRAAGAKQPICGTGWFGVGAGFYPELYSNVPGMDYIDRHHYYGGGPGGWQILQGMPFNDESALKKPECILKLSQERVLGMPYTLSEWASVLPNQWRLEAPPLMAFYGNCLNGWDAPIHFACEGGGGGFSRFLKWMWPIGEPSTLCQYPALSQLIRRGDVKEGEEVFVRNLPDGKLFSAQPLKDVAIKLDISGPYEMSSEQGVNARSLAAFYAAAVGKTGVRFPKEDVPDASIDLTKYIDMQKKEIRAATGELYWNYGAGYVTADTPRTQAAVGFLAGVPVRLGDCEIRTSNRIASILVTSWDGKPLKESRHILITAVGRSRNTDMAYSRGGQRLIAIGKSPVLLEGVKGSVTLGRTGKCTVTALSPYGYKTVEVAPQAEGGKITIPMTGENKAVYYEVKFE
ncbi:MAG TPA: hypothetical protein VNA25_16250 [Phycisphaerae bacterium]|nr:hypothetical protein [Phycisphaerae bacterium]